MRRPATVKAAISIGKSDTTAAGPAPSALRPGMITAAMSTKITVVSLSTTEPTARPG